MITQLNPMIPVTIPSKDNARGYAFALIDYSQEHDVVWGVALDSGEVWWVPNPDVRIDTNWSMGRRKSEPPLLHKNCEFCEQAFKTGPGTGRRLDAKFCCNEHKIAYHSARRKVVAVDEQA